MRTTLLITWSALVLNNPYLITGLFVLVLLILTRLLGIYCRFISFIIFIVYVGGILILISYCVMLIPLNKFSSAPVLTISVFSLFLFLYRDLRMTRPLAYGLIYSARALFLVAILLFIVMISVVSIVKSTRGSLKFYVQNPFHSLHSYFICFHNHRDPQFPEMRSEKINRLLSSETLWIHPYQWEWCWR